MEQKKLLESSIKGLEDQIEEIVSKSWVKRQKNYEEKYKKIRDIT